MLAFNRESPPESESPERALVRLAKKSSLERTGPAPVQVRKPRSDLGTKRG